MNAPRDYRDFLDDIVGACRSIIRFVDGLGVEAYLMTRRHGIPSCVATKSWGKQYDTSRMS